MLREGESQEGKGRGFLGLFRRRRNQEAKGGSDVESADTTEQSVIPEEISTPESLINRFNQEAIEAIDKNFSAKDSRRARAIFEQLVLNPDENLEKWVKRDDIKKNALLKGLAGVGLLAGGLLAGSTLAVPILMSFSGAFLGRAGIESIRAFKGKTREFGVRLALHAAAAERLEMANRIKEQLSALPTDASEDIRLRAVSELVDGIKKIDDQVLGVSDEGRQNQKGIIGSIIGHEKGWKRWEAVAGIAGGILGGYAGNALAALRGISVDLDKIPVKQIWAAKSKEEALRIASISGQPITEGLKNMQSLDALKLVLTRGMEETHHLVQQTFDGCRMVFAASAEANQAGAGQVIHGLGTGAYGAKELAGGAIPHFANLTKAMSASIGAIIGHSLIDIIFRTGKARGYDVEYQEIIPPTISSPETPAPRGLGDELNEFENEINSFEGPAKRLVPFTDEEGKKKEEEKPREELKPAEPAPPKPEEEKKPETKTLEDEAKELAGKIEGKEVELKIIRSRRKGTDDKYRLNYERLKIGDETIKFESAKHRIWIDDVVYKNELIGKINDQANEDGFTETMEVTRVTLGKDRDNKDIIQIEVKKKDLIDKERLERSRALTSYIIGKAVKNYQELHVDTSREAREAEEKFKKIVKEGLLEIFTHKNPDLDAKTCIFLCQLAGISPKSIREAGSLEKGRYSPVGISMDTGELHGVLVLGYGDEKDKIDSVNKAGVVFDHHGLASGKDTAAAKFVYEALVDLKLLVPNRALAKMVDFVVRADNKLYVTLPKKQWYSNRTLYGLEWFVYPQNLYNFLKENDKDPGEELSDGEMEKLKLKIKSEKKAEFIRLADEAVEKMKEEGFVIESPKYGQLLFELGNRLPSGIGFDAAIADGSGGWIHWMPESQGFFISTLRPIEAENLPQGITMRQTMWLKPESDKSALKDVGEILRTLEVREEDIQRIGALAAAAEKSQEKARKTS